MRGHKLRPTDASRVLELRSPVSSSPPPSSFLTRMCPILHGITTCQAGTAHSTLPHKVLYFIVTDSPERACCRDYVRDRLFAGVYKWLNPHLVLLVLFLPGQSSWGSGPSRNPNPSWRHIFLRPCKNLPRV